MLLSFFGQEQIVHAATLFAALSGAFIFAHYFRPQKRRHGLWRVLFSFIVALLVTGAIYSGFRLICYEQLAYSVMAGSIDVTKYATLSDYHHDIVRLAGGSASGIYYIAWIFYYPLNEALPYIALIWFVLGVAICYLLSRSLDEPASSPSAGAYGGGQIKDEEQEPPIEPKDTRAMNDDQAKFLIDQFNKLASWRMSGLQLKISQAAPMIALLAMFLSVTIILFQGSQSYQIIVIVILGAAFAALSIDYRRAWKLHEDDGDRLLALEGYYSRDRSLPDLTLAKVINFTPRDLKKFLRDNEPKGSPQT
jgi:hypothetical protein